MSETFKINMYFDEKGEELEELIKHLIINILKKTHKANLILNIRLVKK